MTSPVTTKKTRPLSPHLQIYKPQLTTGMSIFHRITGVGLSVGLPVFVVWLVALAQSEGAYDCFTRCAQSIVGKIFMMGWIWAFAFHLCSGVRHLFWDMGLFLEIKQAYKTGYLALAISTLLTLALWCKLVWVM
jgi:succinate dehydrogenase / fumarate reductase cytochrome b subunit